MVAVNERKLHRIVEDRMVAGVCTGLADFLGADVTAMRLAFVVLTLMGGVGVIIYIAAWLIIPEKSVGGGQQLPLEPTGPREGDAASSLRGEKVVEKRLYRSRSQRIIGGVCGGLAEYFQIDVVIVRLIFVLLLFANIPAVIGYIIAWIIIPERKYARRQTPLADADDAKVEVEEAPAPSGGSGLLLGYVLVALGVLLLWNTWLPQAVRWMGLGTVRIIAISWWPVVLIVLGLAFLLSGRGRSSS